MSRVPENGMHGSRWRALETEQSRQPNLAAPGKLGDLSPDLPTTATAPALDPTRVGLWGRLLGDCRVVIWVGRGEELVGLLGATCGRVRLIQRVWLWVPDGVEAVGVDAGVVAVQANAMRSRVKARARVLAHVQVRSRRR